MIKQPWCAVFLSSLLPGVGQIYAGARQKGTVFISIFFFLLFKDIAVVARFLYSDSNKESIVLLGLLALSVAIDVLIFIYSLFDAHKTARKLNETQGVNHREGRIKDPWLAVFLSYILPGIGQFYNRSILKGIIVLVIFLVLFLLHDVHYFFFIFLVPFYVLVLKDAFESAERMNGTQKMFLLLGNRLAIAFVLAVITIASIPAGDIIKTHFVEAFKIPAGSMMPTVLIGDRVLVKRSIEKNALQRGALIVFRYPRDRERNFIKRIIARGGETIEGRDKKITINGKVLDEPYVTYRDTTFGSRTFGPIRVPEGTYFVLGDNRDNSMDSRIWGPVPADDVLGTVFKIYWSWDSQSVKVRWDRIGMRLD